MSDQNELYYAHMEADRNEAEKAYFDARPSLGTDVDRALFRAGFERAFQKLWTQVNTPHTADFMQAIQFEAAHQRERWGVAHDAGKEDSDWFWLIGYLAGKAIRPDATPEKRLHHIITTAAACLNWHAARTGVDTRMRPGIDPPEKGEETGR